MRMVTVPVVHDGDDDGHGTNHDLDGDAISPENIAGLLNAAK